MEKKGPKKFDQYVVTDLPQFAAMPGHHKAAPSWIFPGIFPDVNIRINGSDASKMVNAPHAEPHVHESNPEIYFTATENRGEIVIEVQMDEETFIVESPFAVFIPAGVRHCFKVLKCESPNFIFGMHIMDFKSNA